MTLDETRKVKPGLYRIFWTEKVGAGSSLAVIGAKHGGTKWYACANWISPANSDELCCSSHEYWTQVDHVELIKE